ncbi:hypothetical protein [Rhizobium leguminosarum]|uniref:hypothetical protein n=1 Tax=Rhizobium leguminosarum TaxID=384 RepID=UPI002E0F1632|nr:hypothetical protein U8Q02_39835 [Rhizobium leguminosarum]
MLSSVGGGTLKLDEALKIAHEMAAARHELWSRATTIPVKQDLDQTQVPLFELLEAARKSPQVSRPTVTSRALAEANGFGIWDTGGGCRAYGIMLREEETPGGDVAILELLITTDQGSGVSAEPHERAWQAGVSYTDPRGGETLLISEDGLTLEDAIAQALEYAVQADRLWDENYDRDAIAEYVGGRRRP